jgi:hypothetical protein
MGPCGPSKKRQFLPGFVRCRETPQAAPSIVFSSVPRRTAATFLRRSLHNVSGMSQCGVSDSVTYVCAVALTVRDHRGIVVRYRRFAV